MCPYQRTEVGTTSIQRPARRSTAQKRETVPRPIARVAPEFQNFERSFRAGRLALNSYPRNSCTTRDYSARRFLPAASRLLFLNRVGLTFLLFVSPSCAQSFFFLFFFRCFFSSLFARGNYCFVHSYARSRNIERFGVKRWHTRFCRFCARAREKDFDFPS